MKNALPVVMALIFAILACNLTSTNAPNPTPIALAPVTITGLPPAGATATATSTAVPTSTATPRPGATSTPIGPVCVPRTDWTVFYTVQSGDTLNAIAARTGTTAAALAQGNCLANPDVLSVGQNLRVPRQPDPREVMPTVTGLGFSPTTYSNGQQIGVPSGERITIVATGVTNAVRVEFYYRTEDTSYLIGTDANLGDGVSILWDAPRDGLGTFNMFAEAVSSTENRAVSPFYAVSWGPTCPNRWFFTFSATPSGACPTVLFSGATTAQDFEGGRAFDYPISASDGKSYIFVLYNDGSYDYFVDEYNSDAPLDNSDLTVPANRYAPDGSIGYLWKNNETVRNRLGWAYSPVESFTGRWQFAEGGQDSTTFPPLFPGWSVYIDYGKSGLVLNLIELSAGNGGRRWQTVGGY